MKSAPLINPSFSRLRKTCPGKTYSLRSRRRGGSVVVLVGVSIMFLLGCVALAVDYGLIVADANRLQRGCDAGALAGARKLKQTFIVTSNIFNDVIDTQAARTEAVMVAAANGVTVNPNDITFSNNNSKIRVPATTTRTFFFARALGRNSGTITRSATASIAAGDQLSTGPGNIRLAPIGITWETYNAYYLDQLLPHDITLVRQNKETFGLNDMVLFDLKDNNAKSPAKMQDQLTGAIAESSAIGDQETTLNAAKPAERKHLTDGLDILFDRSSQPPWNDNDSSSAGNQYNNILNGTIPRNNPRVVYIIVTPSTSNPHNGTFDTEVQGFVPVYLESYQNVNILGETVTQVRMRFLPAGFASDGDATPNSGGSLSGVRVVSLSD